MKNIKINKKVGRLLENFTIYIFKKKLINFLSYIKKILFFSHINFLQKIKIKMLIVRNKLFSRFNKSQTF